VREDRDVTELERRDLRMWDGLLLALLAVCAGLGLVDEGASPGTRLGGAALAAGFAAAHLALRRLEGGRAPWGTWLGVAHAVLLVAATFALLALSDAFGLVVYALYPHLFLLLGWWALPGIAAITVWSLSRMDLEAGEVGVSAGITTALALGIGLSMNATSRHAERQAQTIRELEQAREEVHERGRTIGALEERQRLARELHDTVAQGLVSVVTQLEAAEQELEGGRIDRVGERVARAREVARDALGDARRAVAALRPDVLERSGLAEALQGLSGPARDGAPAVEVRADVPAGALRPDAEVALLRCAQEALANARRHAGATTVRVDLRLGDAAAELRVRDDGRGFDPAEARPGGFGLVALRERAAAVGGDAEVTSVPGAGTEVRAWVPKG
jgi:signal transduction histidine kinase